MAIIPNDSRLIKFSDYIVENYIETDSTFPPTLWAEFSASMDRTTNACESFHSRFNANFYKTHPSLFIFMQKLNDFQTDTYIKLQSLNEKVRIKDPDTRRRHEFLKLKIDNFKNDEIFNFVKSLGYFYKL